MGSLSRRRRTHDGRLQLQALDQTYNGTSNIVLHCDMAVNQKLLYHLNIQNYDLIRKYYINKNKKIMDGNNFQIFNLLQPLKSKHCLLFFFFFQGDLYAFIQTNKSINKF